MKIVVLSGGLSPERDVSLSSAALISNALIEKGHEVMLLDLYLGIDNKEIPVKYYNKSSNEVFSYTVPKEEPDLNAIKSSINNGESLIGNGVLDLCRDADVVFLALHGSIGENGKLQAVFDVYGIKYTGTGYAGSLLAMDKDLSKKLMQTHNILTPAWRYINLKADFDYKDISYPCVVKPCSCGSSVGVAIVENSNEFDNAINQAKKYEDNIIIEEKINGREFSVGILDGTALPVIEIKPLIGFYDYKNKYQKGLSSEICPADISDEVNSLLLESALQVHNALRLGYYSRVDFILDDNNKAYCLEVNTLPGMTPTSLLPQEALVNNISYNDLCEKIALSVLNNLD